MPLALTLGPLHAVGRTPDDLAWHLAQDSLNAADGPDMDRAVLAMAHMGAAVMLCE